MDEPKREPQLHRSATVRGFYNLAGWIFVGLAALGAVLPLLPTTIFLLLAAACFARGSERFYDWLLGHRHFGPMVRDWQAHRTIPRRAKRKALLLILLTFTVTIGFFLGATWLRLVVGAVGLAVFTFVARLPESESRPRPEPEATNATTANEASGGPAEARPPASPS